MGICKERLVAQGLSQQQYGIDFLDTFSFVAKLTSVWILLSLPSQWTQWGIGIWLYLTSHQVYKLNKSLYGLRQASRHCFQKFSSTIFKLGFKQNFAENSLFTNGSGNSFVALRVTTYVDDQPIGFASILENSWLLGSQGNNQQSHVHRLRLSIVL